MGHSVVEIPRGVRRRLKGLAQKPSEHGRRAHAILLLWETGNCVARVARGLYAARSSVQRWRALYEEYGEQGLRPLERGRSEWKRTMKCSRHLDWWTPRRETMAISGEFGVVGHRVASAHRRAGPCDGSSAWGSDIGVRDRRCAFATRTRHSACRPLLTPWPRVPPTVRCSMPTRPTSTSTRESALPGWPGEGRAGFLLRARTRSTTWPAH